MDIKKSADSFSKLKKIKTSIYMKYLQAIQYLQTNNIRYTANLYYVIQACETYMCTEQVNPAVLSTFSTGRLIPRSRDSGEGILL